jgi:transposase InsO family protein
MAKSKRRRSDRALRPRMRSPGRAPATPHPPGGPGRPAGARPHDPVNASVDVTHGPIGDACSSPLQLPNREVLRRPIEPKQYASDEHRKLLDRNGITCSMSRRANCWDNAVVESFFGTMKTELIYRKPWPTRESAHQAVAEYIELFYNTNRRHSFLGQQSPAKYEREYADSIKEAA